MHRLLARGRGPVHDGRRGRRVLLKPRLVERAQALAFERSCSDEAGRLLHALAAQRGRERVGEIGTGVGVGTAWIASAVPPGVPVYTAELDAGRAAAARAVFAEDPDVHVLAGDWHDSLAREAPFDLLFVDAKPKEDPAPFLGLVVPGGTIVIDDLTPGRSPDPLGAAWLGHRELLAVELAVSAAEAVIVAVTRR